MSVCDLEAAYVQVRLLRHRRIVQRYVYKLERVTKLDNQLGVKNRIVICSQLSARYVQTSASVRLLKYSSLPTLVAVSSTQLRYR